MAAVRCDGGLPVERDGRRAEFMAFTSSLPISLSCLLVVSLALQILTHFSRVSLFVQPIISFWYYSLVFQRPCGV